MKILMGIVGLLSINSTLLAKTLATAPKSNTQKMDAINASSLKSIEKTWLSVPAACKARGFNADPIAQSIQSVPSHIQNIYASFQA